MISDLRRRQYRDKRSKELSMEKITTCLWFDTEAEEAAQFYTSIFPDSRIVDVSRYGEAGPREAGSVMTVSFELLGHTFVGLNGGPDHKIGGVGISFMVRCESQDELDGYWARLADGGDEIACGWLTDRYGVAWQIVPTRLQELLGDPDPEKAQRVMRTMLQMKKLEISELERAASAPASTGV
jgi:predicted 3-demethylubiquinone-9 3-methyltransferase (glyoxalase superfamily)